MGNKPTRKRRLHQPYNQMVKDAISALKDRPGSTEDEVFEYLEDKYGGRIPPKTKKNLETVMRSIIKTKNGPRRGRTGGRLTRSTTTRKVRFKSKLRGPAPRRRPGRPKARKLVTRPRIKGSKKSTTHHLRKRAHRGTPNHSSGY